jgi:RNA polymerase sigma factor (sigma-70 family)
MPLAATLSIAMTTARTSSQSEGPAPQLRIDWQAALAEHDRWLRMVVRARLGEWQAVDEIMQEVSLAAVAQRAPLADASKIAPWLYRLAVTQVLLYRRKHGRRRNLVDRYARDTQPTEVDRRTVDPLDWLLADERGRSVRAALATLPARDAEILLLKYAEDWSYHEIARHLGISHSAVEARLHRARQRLREGLTARNVIEV